jgi:uncharacterized membrane protein
VHKIGLKFAFFAAYLCLTFGWMAASFWLPNGWIREIATLPWLIVFPGYVALRTLAGPTPRRLSIRSGGYVIGLSLLLLMLVGLILNQAYIFMGFTRPFSLLPLTIAIGSTVAVLSAVAAAREVRSPHQVLASIKHQLRRTGPKSISAATIIAGLLLPVLSIAGAVTLNNGGTAGLAVVGMCSTAMLLMLLLLRDRQLSRYYGYILYCMCVSILLATSMRGWNITGHDVMQEYQVFQLTLSHATWHMSYYHDAYTACLSITILPTMLQKISGMDAPFIFKLVFQAIAAVVAVVLYGSLRQYANRRIALLASFLFITFPTFITDMSMLNRQEMGMLFFALMLHTGTNKRLSKRLKSTLVFLFMVGMILSHYSTSYVAIGSIVVAYGAAFVWKYGAKLFVKKHSPPLSAFLSIISPVVLVASVLVLLAWGTIATQTSNNIAQTVQAITSVASGKSQSGNTLLTLQKPTISQFSSQAQATRTLPNNLFYPDQVLAKYPLQSAKETVSPVSSFGKRLHLPQALLQTIYNLARSVYALVIEGGFGIGLLYCLLRKRRGRALPRQYLLMAIGLMVVIALQVVLPTAINYGLTRILQQALLVLALPVVISAVWLMRLMRIPRRISEMVIGISLAVFFLVLSGALPSITGGYKPSLTTANNGFYYAAYYTHQDEIAAAQWLEYQPAKGSRVYSDEFMRRKLITYGGIFSQPLITPNAIPVDSYVLLSNTNVTFDQVPAYDNGTLIYYKPPTSFLQNNKDLVYNSDGVEIYR